MPLPQWRAPSRPNSKHHRLLHKGALPWLRLPQRHRSGLARWRRLRLILLQERPRLRSPRPPRHRRRHLRARHLFYRWRRVLLHLWGLACFLEADPVEGEPRLRVRLISNASSVRELRNITAQTVTDLVATKNMFTNSSPMRGTRQGAGTEVERLCARRNCGVWCVPELHEARPRAGPRRPPVGAGLRADGKRWAGG